MNESCLPREYRNGGRGFRDVPFRHAALVDECRHLGDDLPGLFLFGESQTFKTTIAAAKLAEWIREPYIGDGGRLFHRAGRFVDATDLMTEIQATYREDASDSREAIVERYSRTPALVVDDIGQEKASHHAGEVLRQILDRRRRDLRPGFWLIVTSNFRPEELCSRFAEPQTGNAILHRIAQLTVTIPVGAEATKP